MSAKRRVREPTELEEYLEKGFGAIKKLCEIYVIASKTSIWHHVKWHSLTTAYRVTFRLLLPFSCAPSHFCVLCCSECYVHFCQLTISCFQFHQLFVLVTNLIVLSVPFYFNYGFVAKSFVHKTHAHTKNHLISHCLCGVNNLIWSCSWKHWFNRSNAMAICCFEMAATLGSDAFQKPSHVYARKQIKSQMLWERKMYKKKRQINSEHQQFISQQYLQWFWLYCFKFGTKVNEPKETQQFRMVSITCYSSIITVHLNYVHFRDEWTINKWEREGRICFIHLLSNKQIQLVKINSIHFRIRNSALITFIGWERWNGDPIFNRLNLLEGV